MPFEGVKGSGDRLKFALEVRAQRLAEQAAQQKAAMDAQKAQMDMALKMQKERRESQKHLLDIANARRTALGADQESVQELQPQLAVANDPTLPAAQRQGSANAFIAGINDSIESRARIERGAGRSPDLGTIGTQVGAEIGGAQFAANRAAEAERAESDRVSARDSAESLFKAIVLDDRKLDNTVKKSVAKAQGEYEAGKMLLEKEKSLKEQIRDIKASGGDASDLEALLEQTTALRKAKARPGQVTVNKPLEPGLELKSRENLAASLSAVNLITRIANKVNNGEISLAVKGSVRGFVEQFTGIARDLSSIVQPSGARSAELQRILREAENGAKEFKFEDSNGEQLTLGADAMVLAWQWVRSERDSARMTLFEFELALKELGLTGITKTEAQVKSVLRKVLRRASERVVFHSRFLSDHGSDPTAAMNSMRPEDQATMDQLSGRGGSSQSSGGKAAPRKVIEDPNYFPSNAELIEALRADPGAP